MKKVSVSFLSSKNAQKDLIKIGQTTADYIHVDVMDGKFVKKKNNPYKVLNKLSSSINKRLDVHLMEKKPAKNINRYATLNTEYITIHVEIDKVEKYIDLIREYGIKCGIALNPDTDLSIVLPYLSKIDLILLMSVYPGKGGQEFIDETTKRILKLKKILVSKKSKAKISVDGGINEEISKRLDFADILVSGSYITNSDNYEESINILRENSEKLKKAKKKD